MLRSFGPIAVLVFLYSVTFAQSGRPVANLTTTKTESTEKYSETKPSAKRPPRVFAGQPIAPPKASANADTEDTIKVNTNLITLPVSVFDRNGVYIPNIRQEEFQVFENGVEQQIAYFGTSDKPFTVVLLLDTSLSTQFRIDEIRAGAKAFVEQLKMNDRVMVVEFYRKVNVLSKLTNDREDIFRGIDKAEFDNGTSIYDAVDKTLREYLKNIQGRKAVVLFTDGVDTTSKKASFESTLRYAEESDTMIFPIYYNTFQENRRSAEAEKDNEVKPSDFVSVGYGLSAAEYAAGKKYVEELADYTGGRVFLPEATPGGLTRAFEGIAEELRRQYSIGYIPEGEVAPGQRRQIKVRINRPNLLVRSRDSYVVGTAP